MALYAGYAEQDITPKTLGIPLEGLGATMKRRSTVNRDPLFVRAAALGNEPSQPEALLLTFDWINVKNAHVERFRQVIEDAAGIPGDRILIGGTHTHAGPDIYSSTEIIETYLDEVVRDLPDTVRKAVSDMREARLSFGHGPAGREGAWLNFCKHYRMAPVEKRDSYTEADLVDVGDNYGSAYSGDPEHWFYAGHEEEADHELQLLRFSRAGADDIVFLNFQAHALIAAHGKAADGGFRTELSSDFPGVTCRMLERQLPGTHFIYYQGAAGNVNCSTRMPEEGLAGLTYESREPEAYSAVLSQYAKRILANGMTESVSENVRLLKHTRECENDHSNDWRVPDAEHVFRVFQEAGKNTPEVKELLKQYGFNSPYHAEAILSKSRKPAVSELELNALRIGDTGFVTAPFEMFSATALYIKAHSPFALTFVKAYSCGSHSYMPSANTCADSYEQNCTRFKPGTAEELAEEYVEMLHQLR